jgi:hypothetical protein
MNADKPNPFLLMYFPGTYKLVVSKIPTFLDLFFQSLGLGLAQRNTFFAWPSNYIVDEDVTKLR